MRRSRRIKQITMIALIVAIVGMSIGFAAFSSTLTISSSATVTPNDDQLSLKIYGYTEETSENVAFISYYNDSEKSNAYPFKNQIDGNATGAIATIDNDNFIIKDISADFKTPGIEVDYYFAIKNEGAYDVYINLDELSQQIIKTCTAGEGTSKTLVNEACNDIKINFSIANQLIEDLYSCIIELEELVNEAEKDGDITEEEDVAIIAKEEECYEFEDSFYYDQNSTGSHKIAKGSYIILGVAIDYRYLENQTLADGTLTINFSDIKLNFTTNDPHLEK